MGFLRSVITYSTGLKEYVYTEDLGISHAVVISDGQYFDYTGYYVLAQRQNRMANKSLHRKKKGSQNRKKAQHRLSVIGKNVTNHRDEFLHQVSRKMVNSADIIIFEDLNIQGILKNHCLAMCIQDVSWGKLIRFTQSKAERAGKCMVFVDLRNTSKQCSGCETIVPKDLSERQHRCPSCGLSIDRDLKAAKNILTLGLRGIAYGEMASGLGGPLSHDRNIAKRRSRRSKIPVDKFEMYSSPGVVCLYPPLSNDSFVGHAKLRGMIRNRHQYNPNNRKYKSKLRICRKYDYG
jgi:IS605 OrfB family transposase